MILASASSIRGELLCAAGLDFQQISSGVDENAQRDRLIGLAAPDQALILARLKALSVSGDLVIGADQILEFNGEIMHKPGSREEAFDRLRLLRGHSHHMHTAVAIHEQGEEMWSHVESALLTMYDASDEMIEAICREEGDNLMSSPGAYRLEGPAVRLFSAIRGDYFAILGLPLLPLLAELRRRGAITS